MKALFLTSISFILLLLSFIPGRENATESADYMERSLIMFCESRGYDPDNMTSAQTDEFLDCWRGSVEEEEAMENEL